MARTPDDIFPGLGAGVVAPARGRLRKMFSPSSVLNVNGKIFRHVGQGSSEIELVRAEGSPWHPAPRCCNDSSKGPSSCRAHPITQAC